MCTYNYITIAYELTFTRLIINCYICICIAEKQIE